jgi:Outer membrane protein beta-barrel domain
LKQKNPKMKNFLLILCFFTSFPALAQLAKLGNLPGNFAFDLGFSQLNGAPSALNQRFFDSRSINVAYLYEVRLGGKFTFHPGLGFGAEKYSFANSLGLAKNLSRVELVEYVGNNGQDLLNRSVLSTTYLDIPLELRFSSSTGRKAFHLALGFKAGVLLASNNKLVYAKGAPGDLSRTKNFSDFYLNPIRYGVYGRVGYSAYHLFAYYGLSEMFQSGKGPAAGAINPIMLGVSVVVF